MLPPSRGFVGRPCSRRRRREHNCCAKLWKLAEPNSRRLTDFLRTGHYPRRPSNTGGRLWVRVLITGGAGFVASHLADELLDHGYPVRALDNLATQVHGASGRPRLSR
ncbi:MAG: dTDP-L-rhamnose 4-epimerase [Verrucomicrobiota bacterium]|jgi:hypothetical protein